MSNVYCRGCGKEIDESAPTCQHCGAPQKIKPSTTIKAIVTTKEKVYLFQRAKLLNDKLGYPILWCILFLMQLAGL